MITRVNHIGIAVKSLDKQLGFYRDILKLEYGGIEEVQDQNVRVAIFKVGEVCIELLEPTSDESPIAKFLEKRGEGMHHIAYETDNLENEIDEMKKASVKMIDNKPRLGAHSTNIAFLHPRSSGKVLTEICQHK